MPQEFCPRPFKHCLIWVAHPEDPNSFRIRCAHCDFRKTDWLIDAEPGTRERCAASSLAHAALCERPGSPSAWRSQSDAWAVGT